MALVSYIIIVSAPTAAEFGRYLHQCKTITYETGRTAASLNPNLIPQLCRGYKALRGADSECSSFAWEVWLHCSELTVLGFSSNLWTSKFKPAGLHFPIVDWSTEILCTLAYPERDRRCRTALRESRASVTRHLPQGPGASWHIRRWASGLLGKGPFFGTKGDYIRLIRHPNPKNRNRSGSKVCGSGA